VNGIGFGLRVWGFRFRKFNAMMSVFHIHENLNPATSYWLLTQTKKQAWTLLRSKACFSKNACSGRLLRVFHLNGCGVGGDFLKDRHGSEGRCSHITGAASAGRGKDSNGAGGDGKEDTNHGGLDLA
jgi:hypothetical protein